jgi:uncharacterized protein YcnI
MRLALLTGATVLLLAVPAAAHVTVHGEDAVRDGDDARIVFTVPNEESTAKTTKVDITLPTDTPIAGVYAENKPGWSVTTERVTLKTPIETDDGKITTAVNRVVWTATAGGTGAGQFDEFVLAAGHLPDTASLTFKALQTYSSGETVRWIETAADAEHPAPVLTLGAAADGVAVPTPSVTVTTAPSASAAPGATKASQDGTAKALGGAGLGVAVLAALLALGALLRSGRRTARD